MASIAGRGSAGISTNGPENTKSVLLRPDISGSEFGPYVPHNPGIHIKMIKAKKKSKIVNPKI